MKRLVVFAGYDKDNIIDDYVIYYIKELKKIADIIYVSDCNMLDNELQKISDYCLHIINGRHEEYDFGSYKRGYLYAKENNLLNNYDYLILCNDSCYGPLFNFQEIVKNMENKNTDVWGMFYCLQDKENDEHLQSYFLAIKSKVYLSEYFDNFLSSVKKEKDKWEVVRKYEIGLGILLKKENVSISYLLNSNIKYKEEDNNVPFFNATKAIQCGFPFLKILVLREFVFLKFTIYDLKKLLNLIKNSYDINLIVNHLNRIMVNKKSIKYLFPRFKKFNFYFINKKIVNISSKYSVLLKYQITLTLFNSIHITINFPESISYIDYKYKDFNFLLQK
ncbi:rhamnan synthesis F family protein [Brachyspira pulli]|uniref:rhamnan synthesis F family protein n=1 Tax=Brachyspira pulli TaxID=310721 RepID=UPI003005CEDA